MVEEQQTGENVEAAAQQTQHLEEQPTQEVQQEERQVPLSALEAERSQRQKMQEELSMIKDHLSLLQARQQQPQPQPQQPESSLADDDVMTYGEFKKVAGQFQKNFQATIGELQMSKKYPDYEEVIRKYLPDVLKEDPSLRDTLATTQDYNLAYRLAKTSEKYLDDNKKRKKSQDAQRILENSQQPGNLSSVGGTTPISMAKRYKDMSDADFRREVAKNMGGA